jgi:hypothetical protein
MACVAGAAARAGLALGVRDGTGPPLATSPLSMTIIGTNFRGDKISMGEKVLDRMGYSPFWVVDEEKARLAAFLRM